MLDTLFRLLYPMYASWHLSTSSDLAFYLLATTNAGAFVGRLLSGILPNLDCFLLLEEDSW